MRARYDQYHFGVPDEIIGKRKGKATHIIQLSPLALIRKHSSDDPRPVLEVLVDGRLQRESLASQIRSPESALQNSDR
jgi:hypothetical protein